MIWMSLGIFAWIVAFVTESFGAIIIGGIFLIMGFYKWVELQEKYEELKQKYNIERSMW